jgi:hypothetical protein
MGVVSLLAAYNFIYFRDKLSLGVLITALVLGTSIKAYFLAFSLPFPLLLLIFYRKEILSFKKSLDISIKQVLPLFLVNVALIITLAVFVMHNSITYGNFFGDPEHVKSHANQDSLSGACCNALRYGIQILSLPDQFGGIRLQALHDRILGDNLNLGGSYRFKGKIHLTTSILSPPDSNVSWYGPLPFFLILTSILYAAVRGAPFIRLASFSLIILFAGICYNICWMPTNNRFFSLFFGSSGICLALLLSKINRKSLCSLLLVISLLSLAYGVFLNLKRPAVNLVRIGHYLNKNIVKIAFFQDKTFNDYDIYGYSFLPWVYYVINRDGFYIRWFKDDRLDKFITTIRPHSEVLMISNNNFMLFPYFLKRPDLNIVLSGFSFYNDHGRRRYFDAPEDIFHIIKSFDYIILINRQPPAFLDDRRLVLSYNLLGMSRGKGDSFLLYDYTTKPRGAHGASGYGDDRHQTQHIGVPGNNPPPEK